MTLYTDRKPREAVARAIHEEQWRSPINGKSDIYMWDSGAPEDMKQDARVLATAALNTLRELGFITSEGLDAIHAEEDANGEPRSSVVPGERR